MSTADQGPDQGEAQAEATQADGAQADATAAPPRRKRSLFRRVLTLLLILVVGYTGIQLLSSGRLPTLPFSVSSLFGADDAAEVAEAQPEPAAAPDAAPGDAADAGGEAGAGEDMAGDAPATDDPAPQAAEDATPETETGTETAAAPEPQQPAAATEPVAEPVAERLAALETAVASGPETPAADPEVLSRLEALEEQAGSLRASLARAMEEGGSDPASLAALRAEFQAAAQAIDRQAEALSAVEAALTAQQAEIDALAGELEAMNQSGGTDVSSLADQIAALQAARAADLEARADLASAAEDARRAATLSESFAVIDRAMTFGEPFAGALETAREATDIPPPEALEKAAQDGAPTREALKAGFPDAAYAAITASLEEEATEQDPGLLSSVLARFEARVTGLPDEPIAGDSVPAKLSRARAALLAGDIDTAVATVQALPEAAQAAMADWTEGAILRSDADVALRRWRAEVKRAL